MLGFHRRTPLFVTFACAGLPAINDMTNGLLSGSSPSSWSCRSSPRSAYLVFGVVMLGGKLTRMWKTIVLWASYCIIGRPLRISEVQTTIMQQYVCSRLLQLLTHSPGPGDLVNWRITLLTPVFRIGCFFGETVSSDQTGISLKKKKKKTHIYIAIICQFCRENALKKGKKWEK